MAHVVKSPNGVGWECRWSFPDPDNPDNRKFQKERFPNKAQAEAQRRDVEGRKARNLTVDHRAGKETLKFWANEWHKDYASTVKPNTARTVRTALDSTVIPRLGHLPIRDVQTSVVAEFLRYIEASRTGRNGKPISPATIKFHYRVLGNVLQYAVERKAITYNPASGVRLPTNKARGLMAREPLFLTPVQVSELAEAMPPDTPYGLLTTFLAFTGLRVGECAGLNIEDVDLEKRKVTVKRTRTKVKGGWEVHTPKSGKARTTPLPRQLAADLRAYLAEHPHGDDPDAPLWPGRKITARTAKGSVSALDYDQPWTPAVFYRSVFKPAVRATPGIPDALRQHDLRHSFASICASRGIPAAQIAAWMGHGNEIVTRTIYTHLFAEDTTAHEAALDAAFARGARDDNVVRLPRLA